MGVISDFLECYSKEKTIKTYRTSIKRYLEFLFNDELELRKKARNDFKIYESIAERYLNEQRDFGRDLVRFASWLAKKDVLPKTASVYISAVKEWLF